MNYTLYCYLFFPLENENKAQEIYNILSASYGNNLDSARGKNIYDTVVYPPTNVSHKFISFWATFSDKNLRDDLFNTANQYKQYCWLGDDVEHQIIQRSDTSSPTYGSPLFNIEQDTWGMDE